MALAPQNNAYLGASILDAARPGFAVGIVRLWELVPARYFKDKAFEHCIHEAAMYTGNPDAWSY